MADEIRGTLRELLEGAYTYNVKKLVINRVRQMMQDVFVETNRVVVDFDEDQIEFSLTLRNLRNERVFGTQTYNGVQVVQLADFMREFGRAGVDYWDVVEEFLPLMMFLKLSNITRSRPFVLQALLNGMGFVETSNMRIFLNMNANAVSAAKQIFDDFARNERDSFKYHIYKNIIQRQITPQSAYNFRWNVLHVLEEKIFTPPIEYRAYKLKVGDSYARTRPPLDDNSIGSDGDLDAAIAEAEEAMRNVLAGRKQEQTREEMEIERQAREDYEASGQYEPGRKMPQGVAGLPFEPNMDHPYGEDYEDPKLGPIPEGTEYSYEEDDEMDVESDY